MLRFVLRKIRAKKWMMLSLLIGNILMIAIACVGPMYVKAVLQKSMLSTLSSVMTEDNIYPGTVTLSATMNKTRNVVINQENYAAAEKAAHSLDEASSVPLYMMIDRVMIPNVKMVSNEQREEAAQEKHINLGYLSDLKDHSVIVSGDLYSSEIHDHTIDVIVSEKGLLNMDLLIGETLTLKDYTDKDGKSLNVRIAGVFSEKEQNDAYWVQSPSGYSASMLMDEELFKSLFVADDIAQQEFPLKSTWYALLDYTQMKVVDAPHYIELAQSLSETFSANKECNAQTAFEKPLTAFLVSEKRVRVTITVLEIPIFALLIVFIFMVSRQLIEMEESEIAVLKSRGAGRGQIILIYLVQSLVIAVLSLAGGIPLSLFLCQMIGSANAFLEFVSRTALPAKIDLEVILYGVVAAVISILTMVLPVISVSKTTIVAQKRSKRGSRKMPWWQKMGLDVLLLGVSVYGYYSFNRQKELLYQQVLEGQQLDPLLYLSATLFIIGAGLLMVRLLPYLTHLIYLIGKRFWSPALFASFLQVIRTKGSQGFIMIFLMFTIALGLFNATAARTIGDNAERSTRYSAGADIVFQEAWADNSAHLAATGETDAEIAYTEPDYDNYTLLPEVQSITKVLNTTVTVNLPSTGFLKSVRLLGINTNEFGETAWFDNDLLPVHWYNYLNAISSNAKAVLVSENFESDYGYDLGDIISFRNADGDTIRGVIYGFVPYFPTYASVVTTKGSDGIYRDTDSYLIVAHLSQVQSTFGVTPYEIWMKTGDNSTQFIYDYISTSGKKLHHFTDAKAQLITIKNEPVYQGTNGILTVGFIVTLILCSVGFLIYWILSIRQRELQMGIFRAMGMSMREIIGMLINEQVFISGLSIVSGFGIGAAASFLFVPLIQIAYSTTDQVVPLKVVMSMTDNLRLLAIVGAVMVLCLVILGLLISRMKIATALKLGED